jgi:hypothetical protein
MRAFFLHYTLIISQYAGFKCALLLITFSLTLRKHDIRKLTTKGLIIPFPTTNAKPIFGLLGSD